MRSQVKLKVTTAVVVCFMVGIVQTQADDTSLLVEAESFSTIGGWKLDTQFIDEMGSPYLLAHGLGRPVANATTTVELPWL